MKHPTPEGKNPMFEDPFEKYWWTKNKCKVVFL